MATISNTRAERIARNINAMDMDYHYSDCMRTYKFWSKLYNKLTDILKTLTDADKATIAALCKVDKAKYFGIA